MSDLATRTIPGVAATVESFIDDAQHGRVSVTDLHRVQKAAFRALAAKASLPRATLTTGRATPKLKDLPKAEKKK